MFDVRADYCKYYGLTQYSVHKDRTYVYPTIQQIFFTAFVFIFAYLRVCDGKQRQFCILCFSFFFAVSFEEVNSIIFTSPCILRLKTIIQF